MTDVGDVYSTHVVVRDSAGNPADAGAVTCTVTLPDDSAVTLPVQHVSTGTYAAGYPVTQPGTHLVTWRATGANASAWDDSFTASDPTRVLPLSLTDVKAMLRMESAAYDDILRTLIVEVCEAGEEYTGKVFGRRTTTEVASGSGDYLLVPATPILDVFSVTVDGVPAEGWQVEHRGAGLIYWPTRPVGRLYEVTYRAGYRVQPKPHVTGARTLVKWLWKERQGAVRVGTPLDDMLPFGIPHAVADFWDLLPGAGFA